MKMKTYYIANVVEVKLEGEGEGSLFNVRFETASDKGRRDIALVEGIESKQRADNLAAFWMTGGHEMLLTVFQNELIVIEGE